MEYHLFYPLLLANIGAANWSPYGGVAPSNLSKSQQKVKNRNRKRNKLARKSRKRA